MCYLCRGIADAYLNFQNDDQKVKDFGVSLATNMIQRLTSEGDIKGVHFCTLNLERSVRLVLESLQWTGNSLETANKLITVSFLCQ